MGNASSDGQSTYPTWVGVAASSALIISALLTIGALLFLLPIVLWGISAGAFGYLRSESVSAWFEHFLQIGAAISFAFTAFVSIARMPSWLRQVLVAAWVGALYGFPFLVAGGSENPAPLFAVTDWAVAGLAGLLVGLPWIIRRSRSRRLHLDRQV